jgi:hypothetical protein
VSALATFLVLGQLVGLPPPSPPPATLSFTNRSELRVRSRLQGGTAVDAETDVRSALALLGRHDSLTLTYGPRLSYLDIEGDRNLALIHVGRAESAWWTGRSRLTLTLDGSIGSQSAIGLVAPLALGGGTGPPPPGTPTPTLPPVGLPATAPTPTYFPELLVLQMASFRGALGATHAFSRRWSGGATAYFAIAGGLDYDSQRVLPPYRNPGGEVLATYSATRQDQLVSRIRSSYVWTLIQGGDFLTIEATESVRHAWSPRTSSTLGTGLAFLRSQEHAGDGHTGAITGAGEASILNTTPLRDDATLAFRTQAQLGTAYNPVLALVQPQASATVSSAWTRHRVSVTVSADAVASLPFDASNASRLVSGGIVGSYTPVNPVELQMGARTYVQILPATVGASYPPQWVAFLAVLLRSPLLEL